jgi:hypothetical protein
MVDRQIFVPAGDYIKNLKIGHLEPQECPAWLQTPVATFETHLSLSQRQHLLKIAR